VGREGAVPCRLGARPLWVPPALAALAYAATGLLGTGIAGGPPSLADSPVDGGRAAPLTPGSGVAVFWVQIYGARADDLEEARLIGPDGRVLAERQSRLSRHRAQWLVYAGARRRGPAWPAGRYRGEYALYRGPNREKVVAVTRELTLQ